MKKVSWAIQAFLFYLFTLVTSYIPVRLVPAAGRLSGLLMYRMLPGRRRVAVDNIRQVLPHMRSKPEWECPLETPEEIARETFIRMGMSLVETCRLYHGRGDYLIEGIEIRGREHYDAARSRGKGLIFLTGHCGNWELGALAYGRKLQSSISVVARRQNNPFLNSMVETIRMQYDNRIIYKENALRSMLAVIKQQSTIGLLVDQAVFPEEGFMIPFLGRMAWASKAPVVLSRKTGVAVLPSFIHRENGHHVITFYPECVFEGGSGDDEIARDVKVYSECIDRFIIAHPTDWYWVHRRWKRAGAAA